ncbi:MAG: pentapeptide repeat-containing protein [Pseudomonadota bacterium]
MSETLKSHAEIVLFGKVVEDLLVSSENKPRKNNDNDAVVARIYGFSYGGAYYEMDGPTLFVVGGEGKNAMDADVAGPGLDDDDKFYASLKTWTYGQHERSTRMDVESGTFEQLLLQGGGDGGGMSGARVSGARVSGARVSGARISGARLSGARLSGARDASD